MTSESEDAAAAPPDATRAAQRSTEGPAAIDIELLADKVYDLMRAEIEISLMRGAPAPASGRDR